MQREVSR